MLSKAKMIGAGGALLAAFLAGLAVQGWRMGEQLAVQHATHVDQLRRTAEANAAVILQQQTDQQKQAQRLSEIDEKHYEEMQHAQTAADMLADDLAAARKRLSVRIDPASCPVSAATGAAGMDDGARARAELHPATAAGIVRVTGRADECRARLAGLQEWARMISEKTGE